MSEVRVLVVDDDPWILRMVSSSLEKKGRYKVETAKDGQQALARVQVSPPSLIITDVMMPVMDGWTFVQTLRSNPDHATIPVLFLTALGKDEERLYQLGLRPEDYISKPFRFDELERRVLWTLNRSDFPETAGVPQLQSPMTGHTPYPAAVPTFMSSSGSYSQYYPQIPGPQMPGHPVGPHGNPPSPAFHPQQGQQIPSQSPTHNQDPYFQRPLAPRDPNFAPHQIPSQGQSFPQSPTQSQPQSLPYSQTFPQAQPSPPANGPSPHPTEPTTPQNEHNSGARPSGLDGRLEQLSLSSLLVMMEMERKDGVLALHDSEKQRTGRIFLREGRVVHTKIDKLSDMDGKNCVYEMLRWKKGSFTFSAMEVEMEDTVNSSTTGLLMEGARLIDESNR